MGVDGRWGIGEYGSVQGFYAQTDTPGLEGDDYLYGETPNNYDSTQHNAATRNGKKYTPNMVRDLIEDTVASALPKGWMPKKSSDFRCPTSFWFHSALVTSWFTMRATPRRMRASWPR